MSGIDGFKAVKKRMAWARLDHNLPGGLHAPKCAGDVGWDLEAMADVRIAPGYAVDVPINAAVALPEGIWGEIRARSSMARRDLQVDAGTIDTGYRGPLFVLVRNMSPVRATVQIKAGERVGQLVMHAVATVWAVEIEEVPKDTQRGVAGFGSTGV